MKTKKEEIMAKSETTIHSTAIVDKRAELDSGVSVGPYAIIEADTQIGAGCVIDAHGIVRCYTTMGPNCHVHPGAVIGGVPQDMSFSDAVSYVEIGAQCIFREGTTVNRGTKPDSITRLGNKIYMMTQAHVGHNCTVADHVILVNGAALAGYVDVEAGAFLSGFVGIHQFVRVGSLCLIAGACKMDHDVPPFVIVDGYPRSIRRLNTVGLKRAGLWDEATIQALQEAYLGIAQSDDQLATGRALASSDNHLVRQVGKFYQQSERGVMRRFNIAFSDNGARATDNGLA